MTTITADSIIIGADAPEDSLWTKTKNVGSKTVSAVDRFLESMKNRAASFINRHPIIANFSVGTAIVLYWTTVFVAVTVIATYMLIFAFSWTEKIFGF